MKLEAEVLDRVGDWNNLSQWERSEFGKELRRQGMSYGEIMDLIPVKKSTLATWCRDVALTGEQIESIKQRTASRVGIPVDTQWKRRAEVKRIRASATAQAESLITDPLWVAGVVLYWAEGTKGRNRVSMANADPSALRLFIRWLRTYVDPNARFTIHLHLHEGNNEEAAKRYWRSETGLDQANFIKTFIKPRGTGHRKNHLAHGICTVRMRRASDGWNIIMEWIDSVTERFGLDSPT